MFRLKKGTKAFLVDRSLGKQWEVGSEPRFLFVVTPPYSGSTALAQLLNSGPRTALLEERGEGQWLVPSLGNSDRWELEKSVDWAAVKTTWFKRIALLRALVQDVELFIEKSPPNMIRLPKLLETFPNHSLLAFNRDPYANCASILYRFNQLDALSSDQRRKQVRKLAKDWVFRSGWVRSAIEQHGAVGFTYEEFCDHTEDCLKKLSQVEPLLAGLDSSKEVLVKDYAPQKIENHNFRQIAKLSQNDVEVISEVLEEELELVRYFGYEILKGG